MRFDVFSGEGGRAMGEGTPSERSNAAFGFMSSSLLRREMSFFVFQISVFSSISRGNTHSINTYVLSNIDITYYMSYQLFALFV